MIPECSRVVLVPDVSELMDDHVVEEFSWDEEQDRIEDDPATDRAAAPLRAHVAQSHRANPLVECLLIDDIDQLLHARRFPVCNDSPEQAMQFDSAESRTDSDSPTLVC